MIIRNAREEDAAAICEIYNHYVSNTTVSFEEKPVSIEEMSGRMRDVTQALPWLVCEEQGLVVGYAYATKWRLRGAYKFSVESTVYVKTGRARQGIGRKLYGELISQLRLRGIHCIIGGIAQPNEGSVGLHESFGFVKVAHFKDVGRKFDSWVDVAYWELILPN